MSHKHVGFGEVAQKYKGPQLQSHVGNHARDQRFISKAEIRVERIKESVKGIIEEVGRSLSLASKASNILVYRPIRPLKTKRTYTEFIAKSKIDDEYKIVRVYDKLQLIKCGKVATVFRNLKYLKEFFPDKISIYQDFRFLFTVQKNRKYTSLHDLMESKQVLTEAPVKFLAFEIFTQIEALHARGFLHLNLCPKNIGIDEKGDVYLQGFDYLCSIEEDPFEAAYQHLIIRKGNWEFLAPEMLLGEGIDISCDFYSIGMMLYRILANEPIPKFKTLEEYQFRLKDEKRQTQVKKERIPEGWSIESADFINKLIQIRKTNRTGVFSSDEIYAHHWLESFRLRYEEQKENGISFLGCVFANEKNQESYFNTNFTEIKATTEYLHLEKLEIDEMFKDSLAEPDEEIELEFEIFDDITDT